MSLLDDVSIVVTPNGYKAGELYAVIPSDGAADMDVTRATAATRVDENGLVNYAEVIGDTNVVFNGDFDSGSNWSIPSGSGWEIIDGKLKGTNVSVSSATQGGLTFVGKTFQVSYTISDYSQGGVQIYLGNSQSTSLKSENGTHTETITITSSNTILYIYGTSNFTGNIDSLSVKEVTRDNVPRIDYTGGGCPHILAEPQRTNLITYSEDFTDSSWLKTSGGAGSNPIVTSSYATSPEGLVNASRIQFECGGVTSGDYSRLYSSFSLNGSSQYSQSFYIKSNTGSSQNLLFYTQNNDGDSITATTEWVRVDVQFTSNTTNFRNFGLIAKGSIQQTVDVSIYGASLEQGSYATSYIPNFGTALGVTRNQDIFTRDGIGSLINSTEGVLFVEIAMLSDDLTNRFISISNGSNAERVTLGYSNSSNKVFCFFIRW